MNKVLVLVSVCAMICAGIRSVSAAVVSHSPDSVAAIISYIEKDSIIVINQPDGLAEKLKHGESVRADGEKETIEAETESHSSSGEDNPDAAAGTTVKSAGYRVQVFSDNNVKTAKNEARSMAHAISAKFPQYKTYVVFQSPYWRLKVGDFPTQAEAQNALEMIKRSFPNYSRELRVVKDRINRLVK